MNANEQSFMFGPGVSSARPVFRDDDREYPVLALESPRTKRLSGLLLIQQDLQFAQGALKVFKETCLDVRRSVVSQALWFSVVIAYGKCFAQAEGRRMKPEKKDHLRGASEEELSTHDELIELRNQYVAHAGGSLNERADIWIALDVDTRSVKAIFETVSWAFSLAPNSVDRYVRVVSRVLKNVSRVIEKQWKSVEESLDRADIEELSARVSALEDRQDRSCKG